MQETKHRPRLPSFVMQSEHHTNTNNQRTGNIARLGRRHFAQSFQDGTMSFMVAMTKVKARDIHAGIHQNAQILFGPTGGSNGTNNLGLAAEGLDRCRDHIEGDKATGQERDFGRVGDGHGGLLWGLLDL